MIFYLTFGQNNTAFRNGWIEVEAADYITARALVVDRFVDKWSNLYSEKDWQPKYFPLGKIGETLR